LPNLGVVVYVLLSCVGNEGGCERFFCSEGLVHTELRNKLDAEGVNSICFVRANFEWLVNHVKRDSESIEELEYEEIIIGE
jgi:hypothetical protein